MVVARRGLGGLRVVPGFGAKGAQRRWGEDGAIRLAAEADEAVGVEDAIAGLLDVGLVETGGKDDVEQTEAGREGKVLVQQGVREYVVRFAVAG